MCFLRIFADKKWEYMLHLRPEIARSVYKQIRKITIRTDFDRKSFTGHISDLYLIRHPSICLLKESLRLIDEVPTTSYNV